MTPADAGWRRSNLGHLLFAAAGACIADKLAVVREAGFAEVTDAQLAVFRHLDSAGTRLTVLADRAGMTKQAMIELVDRAERQGLVERRSDETDGRAKMVAATRRGRALRAAMDRGLAAAERRFAELVGADALAAIRDGLAAAEGVERMLVEAGRDFVGDVLRDVHRRGYREVTEALLALFRTLDLDGSRLTDVAAAARITKQSMRLLVERAEGLGLVERTSDRADRRARTIRFTPEGLVMLEEMRRGVARAEALFAEAHGDTFLRDLKGWLTRYLASVS